jgi:hypothetical protein
MAQLLSQYLDRLLDKTALDDLDPGMLETAARLAALPELMPPVEPAFEQSVWNRLNRLAAEERPSTGLLGGRWSMPSLSLRWLAPVAALLLIVVLVLPGPRQVLGNWMARFRLENVQVVVAPEQTVRPELAARRQVYDSLAEAADAAGIHLYQPGFLPADYGLASVLSVSYDALPLWLQPLYVESSYRPSQADENVNYYAVVRQFNARRSGPGGIDEIEYQSEAVQTAREILLNDGRHPAVLMEFKDSSRDDQPVLRELIWEQEGITFELWSEKLSLEEMTLIAESMW